MENFLNLAPEQLNYIKSKNTETGQQTKNIIQSSTQSNNHPVMIASANENDKNKKKLNINQLNSKTCYKTNVNEILVMKNESL